MSRIPHRTEDLARPRERAGEKLSFTMTHGRLLPTTIPEPDTDWHPIALRLWESALSSGQSDFYQDSDWALLYSLCEDLSHFKYQEKRSPTMAQVIYSALNSLMLAEGERRRVHVELTAPDEGDDASVAAIDDYKKRLSVAK